MNDPKPFASLGPSLLARKGGARPAMRPQLGIFGNLAGQAVDHAAQLEDLGWNDMGHELDAPRVVADVVKLTPMTAPIEKAGSNDIAEDAADAVDAREILAAAEPAIKEQLRAIAAQMEKQDRAPRAGQRRPALEQGRRAAFTLRLDAARHLRLRLACTIKNRSAQILLTEALDKYLADLPGIDGLVAQVKRS